jgi:hypothetical protein
MFKTIAQRRRQPRQDEPLHIQGFPKGLNTYDAHRAVKKEELVSALNYYLNRSGELLPRPGLVRFTTTPLDGNAYSCESFRINGELCDIVCTTTFKIYKISSVGVPTLLGTVSGLANLFVYADFCVICDGSYLKFLDSSGNLAMAYNAGEGNGLYDKIDQASDGVLKIHSGQISAGVKILFPTFSGGFKVPLTEVRVKLKRVGSPTGLVSAQILQGSTLLTPSSNSFDAATLLTSEQEVIFNFMVNNADQSTWMASNTEYRIIIRYTGGDASNCIELSTINDSDTDGTQYTTVWTDDLNSPLMWLAANLPPKASFGRTTLKRPFISGDPDNPGWVWYGNISIFDWSTPNGGGWVGVIDENRSSFPVGGMGSLYGELYAFGTEEAPYLSKLTGAQPSEYSLLDTFKAVAAQQRTVIDRPNDIWFSRQSGTNNIVGVDSYGSTRTFSQAATVLDRFEDFWDESKDNFAGFIEKLGLYLLYISGSDTVLACHVSLPFQRSRVQADIGHPWTEFKFPAKPTMMSSKKTDFLLGLDDGHIYKFDTSALDDNGTAIEFNWRTAFIDFPFYNVDLNALHMLGASRGGFTFNLNIYTEANEFDITRSILVNLGQTGLLVQEATMLVKDADFLFSRDVITPIFPLNIKCSTVQLEGTNLIRYFYEPAVISGALLKYKTLES